jgi:RHS repeat-associated protein
MKSNVCATRGSQERLFYPFGELWTGAGSSGMHQTFAKLPDYDAETDQYNTLNRHYTPSGRWMSPDPGGLQVVRLDDPQTWNMYAYVRNNPTTLSDPTGLCEPNVGNTPCTVVNGVAVSGDPKDSTELKSKPVAQNEVTPESLRDQIPPDVRATMATAIKDSNSPTTDDKQGGFHEEYGVAGTNASGGWVVSRDKPGPYANPDTADHVSPSGKPANQDVANSIVNPQVNFHVHPSGTTATHAWAQRPSAADKAAALPGRINIVFGARDNKVYFYNNSGVIGNPMKLKDFLGQ